MQELKPFARWRDTAGNRRYLFVLRDGDFYLCRLSGYGLPSRIFRITCMEQINALCALRSWHLTGQWRPDFVPMVWLENLTKVRNQQLDLFRVLS